MVVLELVGCLLILLLVIVTINYVVFPVLDGKKPFWQFRQCSTKFVEELKEELSEEKEKTEAYITIKEIKKERENRK